MVKAAEGGSSQVDLHTSQREREKERGSCGPSKLFFLVVVAFIESNNFNRAECHTLKT